MKELSLTFSQRILIFMEVKPWTIEPHISEILQRFYTYKLFPRGQSSPKTKFEETELANSRGRRGFRFAAAAAVVGDNYHICSPWERRERGSVDATHYIMYLSREELVNYGQPGERETKNAEIAVLVSRYS